MSRLTCKKRAPESEWQASTLRFTLFHEMGLPTQPDGWWQKLAKTAPDNKTSKPKTGDHIEIGQLEDLQLLLHVQSRLGRIDWVLNSGPETGTGGPQDIKNRPLPDIATTFVNIVNEWFATCEFPTANRIAFAAHVNLPVMDLDEGYRTISNYLNFDLDRSTSSDFMYQINRKRKSTTDSTIYINRLTKWNVMLINKLSFAIVGEGLAVVSDPEPISTACRIELDINTDPAKGVVIPRNKLQPILGELILMAREIVREGDI